MENNAGDRTQVRGTKQWVRDAVYGGFMILFSIGNMIYASKLPQGSIKIKAAQAGTYLTIVMIMLCILGACLLVRALVQKPDKICAPLFNRATLVTIAVMAAYIFLMDKIGFLLASFLFVFSLITYYSWEQEPDKQKFRGKALVKRLLPYALCAIITTAVCYYLFGTVLTVVLPRFSLF